MAYIVLAEDDPDIRELVEMFLHRAGHEVACAGHGGEAVAACARRAPDVVVMDVMMPVMSGLEATRLLRAAPETATVPIIMLSAGGRASDRDDGRAAGADLYLTKPFELVALLASIESLLADRPT